MEAGKDVYQSCGLDHIVHTRVPGNNLIEISRKNYGLSLGLLLSDKCGDVFNKGRPGFPLSGGSVSYGLCMKAIYLLGRSS